MGKSELAYGKSITQTIRTHFRESLTGFREWAIEKMPKGNGLDAVLKLCNKAPEFVKAYGYPSAYRTSNRLDRHMDPMARWMGYWG